MKILLTLAAALAVGIGLGGCSNSARSTGDRTTTPAETQYTCSMCGGTYNGPGRCSHCGMALVEKR